ncbi:hypothetical protein SAMN04489724_3323 [Algoriphagus locisalis]|uniref:Uncharacterized protein n=1 Tax=Algoriphagus locisalis TaxID=305507 RepID=A0A1I7CQW0_9BACT|nr:hypothetical protein [Algoriphagus locisalis]SFU01719.1 hypothetical protein SAMN04489724_3323 [Algoriphagus locisalis]
MNTFIYSHTEYVRPSRTIETVYMSDGSNVRAFYIYNYEGYSFRVLEHLVSLISFFESGVAEDYHLDTEEELDCFLERVLL